MKSTVKAEFLLVEPYPWKMFVCWRRHCPIFLVAAGGGLSFLVRDHLNSSDIASALSCKSSFQQRSRLCLSTQPEGTECTPSAGALSLTGTASLMGVS